MKTTAKLTPQGQVNTKGHATANPLQPKAADGENGLLQMKLNPLQLTGGEDEELLQQKTNPLQLKPASDNPLKPGTHTGNPMQPIAVNQPTNLFQLLTAADSLTT